MLHTIFNRNRAAKREILHNSHAIIDFLSNSLGERTLRKYENLAAASTYIANRFAQFGHIPIEEGYRVDDKRVHNIIADIPGKDPSRGLVLIGAHYDTISDTPGADDNASGIAGLLEVYRLLSAGSYARTIRFIAFTLEEPPHFSGDTMGSMVSAKNSRDRGDRIDLMICLEMLGFGGKHVEQHVPFRDMARKTPKRGDFLAVVSLPSSSAYTFLWKKLYNGRARREIIDMVGPSSIPGISHSDHYSYVKQGYPAIMLTDTAFYRNMNYHTELDTMKTINFQFLTENIWNIHLTLASLANLETLVSASDSGLNR
ncbi:MAG: M28 family peptidase [Spirochaetes bacterium]|nr:MAG: M28 family peptidase [Spirochaetota bacterium]